MNDRNNIINEIIDALGDGGSREIAEQVFDKLRGENRIVYDDHKGLQILDDVDVIAEAALVSASLLRLECEEIEASGIDDVDFGDADSYDVSVSIGDVRGTVVVRVGESIDDYEINEAASDLGDLIETVKTLYPAASDDDAREMLDNAIEEIVFPFVQSARTEA